MSVEVNDAPSRSDIVRLEGKVDQIASAISTLILVEERQTNQAAEQAKLRADLERMREQFWMEIEKIKASFRGEVAALRDLHANTDARVSKWVNIGVGAWGAVVLIWTVVEKLLGK